MPAGRCPVKRALARSIRPWGVGPAEADSLETPREGDVQRRIGLFGGVEHLGASGRTDPVEKDAQVESDGLAGWDRDRGRDQLETLRNVSDLDRLGARGRRRGQGYDGSLQRRYRR
jgi:hypothetical protein